MRISDWSSDVCSSDLLPQAVDPALHRRIVDDLVADARHAGLHLQVELQVGGELRQPLLRLQTQAVAGVLRHVRQQLAQPIDDRVGQILVQAGPAQNLAGTFVHNRSEEHTSEIQSLMLLSYSLFSSKKKTKTQNPT